MRRISLSLVLAIFAATSTLMAQQSSPATTFSGAYADERLRLELKTQDGIAYTGTITSGDLKLTLVARATDRELAGTFESSGDKFPFHATVTQEGLAFETDGTRYNLKKEKSAGVNPLAKPPPLNPLAGGGAPKAPPALDVKPPKEKDPLAYRILELQGGTIAQFDNWSYTPIASGGGIVSCDGFPQGRQKDFVLRAAVATPNSQEMANLFAIGPQFVQQVLAQFFGPVFKPSGEPKKTLCGGDEAMVESYEGSANGQKLTCRVIYVKRKDIAIAVMGVGTEVGFKEFGRAIEIVAQSITFKESALEPGMVGTWTAENFSSAGGGGAGVKINVSQARSITLYPSGTFSDTAQSGFSGRDFTGLAQGGSRGKVVKRGNTLTFHYDDATTWSASYELFSNGLKLDGQVYLKQ